MLIAVYYRQIDIVKLLLDRCADVEVKDNDSATPLHLAARNGDTMMMILLLIMIIR